MKPKHSKSPPVEIVLERAERMILEDIAGALVMPYRDVVRARAILMIADGIALAVISRKVGLARRIVRKWATRFARDRFRGLADAPRSGRPPRFSPGRGHAAGEARVRAAGRTRQVAVDVDLR
ncbi:MAG: helix-turn-helix domain-containing protein [Gammaproteobacteria bacterium]